MIAVLGSRHDPAASALAEAAQGRLISAEDLCSPGWVLEEGAAGGWFVAGGERSAVADLTGVLVRRSAVVAEELPWMAEEDRAYVAAEINAFLVAWLSAMPCPVFNRPTPTSLCGPGWSQIHWQHAAARAGVTWSTSDADRDVHDIVVCRRTTWGARSARQARAGRLLARASGTDLLGIRFSDDAVVAVTVQPSLTAPAARALVLGQLASDRKKVS